MRILQHYIFLYVNNVNQVFRNSKKELMSAKLRNYEMQAGSQNSQIHNKHRLILYHDTELLLEKKQQKLNWSKTRFRK